MDFKEFFGTMPLGTQAVLIMQIFEIFANNMVQVVEEPKLLKENLSALGLRQCVRAGEGDSDLRRRIKAMKEIVRIIEDDLLPEVENKAKGAI